MNDTHARSHAKAKGCAEIWIRVTVKVVNGILNKRKMGRSKKEERKE